MAHEIDAVDEVEASLQRLRALIQQLPASREMAYAAITLAQAYQTTSRDYSCKRYPENPQLQQWLETGRRIAEGIGDARAESFALGELASSDAREPIDLITLTACETATGDDRATLGLAGVAIRAGARSAIASLWKIDDATAAQLINEFYGHLKKPGVSKAQAMQAAQIAAIDAAGSGANPGSWAPLILVGNWQ